MQRRPCFHGPRQVGAEATRSQLAMIVPNLGATPLAQNGISPPAQRDKLGAVLFFSGARFDAS